MTWTGKRWWLTGTLIVLDLLSRGLCLSSAAIAQIVPDNTLAGENSRVTHDPNLRGQAGDRIDGGALRGANLFHSFSRFNVDAGQRVYFSNPTGVANILSRITGNDVSDIMGTLGVDGGANLYLLNPNGIIFGPNARLDIAGSFIGSTGDRFTFSDGSEFSATNPQAAPLLTVSIPIGLQYGAQPGAIASQATLATGQDLILAGGNLDLQGQLQAGRDLTLQAQDTVQIRDSTTQPFRAIAANDLLIQGNQAIDIFALNHPNSGLFSGGDMILRSGNAVGGDTHYASSGNFRIEQLDGSPGNLFSPYDPIVRASGDVSLGNYTGVSLHIFAGGSVTAGDITITDADNTDFVQENVVLSDGRTIVPIDGSTTPTLDIRAGTTAFGSVGVTGDTSGFDPGDPTTTGIGTTANIAIASVNFDPDMGGQVFLSNQYQPNSLAAPSGITVGTIDSGGSLGGGDVYIDSRSGITVNGQIITSATVSGSSGDITLFARGDITINDDLNTAATLDDGSSGDINIRTSGNFILNSSRLDSSSDTDSALLGTAGDVNVEAGGSITLNPDSTIDADGQLGGDISLVSQGDMRINSSRVDSSSDNNNDGFATLRIESVNSSVFLDNAEILAENSGSAFAGDIFIDVRDRIDITNNSRISANGDFGRIFIGQNTVNPTADASQPTSVSIDRSQLTTANSNLIDGSGNSGDITIRAEDLVSISNGATLSTTTFAQGNAGNIQIDAGDRISLDNSQVFSSVGSNAVGNGGLIDLSANSLFLTNNASLSGSTFAQGNAGNIRIDVSDRISLNNSRLFSSVAAGAVGNGGLIDLSANSLFLTNNAELSGSTFAQGNAGNIQIDVSDRIFLDNSKLFSSVAAGAVGNGGLIDLSANSLFLTNNASLSGSTFARGNAGNIEIDVGDRISLNNGRLFSSVETNAVGNGGLIDVSANSLILVNDSSLDSGTFGQGNAGNIVVEASDRVFLDNSSIFSDVSEGAVGTGGDVQLTTNFLDMSNDSTVSVSSSEDNSAGDIIIAADDVVLTDSEITAETEAGAGGSIRLQNLETLRLEEGSEISTSTESGIGGTLTINASDSVQLEGNSLLAAAATDGGTAGSLRIRTGTLQVESSEISVSSPEGEAGDLRINAPTVLLDRGSLTALTGAGSNGNIDLQGIDLLLMRNGSQISAQAFNQGTGGNVTVNAAGGFILAISPEDNNIIASAEQGNGGNIQITADGVLGIEQRDPVTPLSDINASSQFGINGTIVIQTPNVNPAQGLIELPTDVVDPSSLVAQGCGAGGTGGVANQQRSEFVVSGRGGLPPSPDDALNQSGEAIPWVTRPVAETSRTGDDPDATEVSADAPDAIALADPTLGLDDSDDLTVPHAIVEAQGWTVSADGEVTLVSDPVTPTAPVLAASATCSATR